MAVFIQVDLVNDMNLLHTKSENYNQHISCDCEIWQR